MKQPLILLCSPYNMYENVATSNTKTKIKTYTEIFKSPILVEKYSLNVYDYHCKKCMTDVHILRYSAAERIKTSKYTIRISMLLKVQTKSDLSIVWEEQ